MIYCCHSVNTRDIFLVLEITKQISYQMNIIDSCHATNARRFLSFRSEHPVFESKKDNSKLRYTQ